ncbi:MAG: hypothetical protein Ct9H300mP23_08090 [Nitrospinota bacterium]|nr:MAG: hypothetical protein Ct9H300mP23_08090 [Nitrospinota bacterium]
MNHFITLDVSKKKLEGKVWRICVSNDLMMNGIQDGRQTRIFGNPFHWNVTVSQKELAFTKPLVFQGNKVSFGLHENLPV